MEIVHQSNIILHVVTGSIALLLGLIALLSTKGDTLHTRSGKYFLRFISVVILTGLIGVFIFGRNTFLLVITVLSGYVSFSGYRTLVLKTNEPKITDILVAVGSLLVLAYFLYYFKSIGMIWSPIIIYSTVGAFLFIVIYDFLRYFISTEKYKMHKIWLYEHIYKMTSAFAALLSAFIGTVFEKYQPHSQYIPSVMGILIIIGFMVYFKKFGLKKLPKS
ncbi:hypothetical protein FK220_018110 [Flavobacteriaceae bacterium TP-CH-4]|uniref:DUF2306 domain-containing protein n=1 Tax=Pelagihabitans pacificus TaxID=2696054 RepID=A0A967AY23_9FLAO|nr:hypothetical protein [Pelagihabitans pacificus]NHF61273.1 hypothetical protein [Pelagihabitans pacificus]